MAYCSQTDIEGEFKGITFSSSTPVTVTELATFIAQTDAIIDGRIGKKYLVPVTGVSSLLILKFIAIQLNAFRVRKITEVKSGESDKDQTTDKGEYKVATKMLDDIVSGAILLSDATLAVSHDGVKSYNYDNDIEAAIDVIADQW